MTTDVVTGHSWVGPDSVWTPLIDVSDQRHRRRGVATTMTSLTSSRDTRHPTLMFHVGTLRHLLETLVVTRVSGFSPVLGG